MKPIGYNCKALDMVEVDENEASKDEDWCGEE